MFSVMNNDDIRKKIWSYLRNKPKPLNYKCNIFFFEKDEQIINKCKSDLKFGDIYKNTDKSKIFIFNNLNKFQQISNTNKNDLLIPISVTKDIINSVDFFVENLYGALDYNSYNIVIQLRSDDLFIKNKFGNLPDYWQYSFVFKNNIGDNIYYLRIKFNNLLEKDFLYNEHSKQDIFNYYKKSKLKKNKFYIHLSKDELVTKMSLSNYKNEYDYNFFEFFVNKKSYNNDKILKWTSQLLKNNNIPIYWDISLITYFKNPFYVCIEFKGPLSERADLLTKIKYDYDILDQL